MRTTEFIPLDIEKFALPIVSIFPLQLGVAVEWTCSVDHGGHTFYLTSKLGTNRNTGLPCACYRREGDARVWLFCDGSISED